ncbi:MAG TPA: serine--tRNA ligase [Patescibacteria group bacterium]|nr:serine--tRNA ligase [Patescibacteria group bacterium]
MLDIKYIRENLELCKEAAKNKNREVAWDKLLSLDEKRRELIEKRDRLKSEKNKSNEAIKAALQKLSPEKAAIESERKKAIAGALKALQQPKELDQLEEELRPIEEQFNLLMLTVPNVPDKSVPIGKDASGNKEIKKWGKVPVFDFPVKDHTALAKSLDLIDFERGAKVGGFRAYYLKNEAALLEFALLFFTFRKLIDKGYTPLIAPSLVRDFTLFGNGQFPWGREEVYHLEKDDLYLAGTAEVPVTAYYANEVLVEKDLPKKFVAFSPCFRREAGSYGKDTKGAYRVHQFNKVEQVIISTAEMSNSLTLHEELLANAEEILQDLELPYRVLLMCTGDMGEPQVKKYDLETWMPGRSGYGETMSNSFMGDFQARRLKIRYKAKDGRMNFCHTLNNTAIASPRILIAILENYQQKDGSIRIPKVLQPFMGKEVIKR